MENCKYRILFLTDDFPPETNAAASRVYERAIFWSKWGHEVTIITNFPNKFYGKKHVGYSNKAYKIEYIDNIKVVRVKTFIAKNEGILLRTVDQLSYMVSAFAAGMIEKKPDIIIATVPQIFCGYAGFLLSFFKKRPLILEIADIWIDSVIGTLNINKKIISSLKRMETNLYKSSDHLVVLTKRFKEDIRSRGINSSKIDVILNGVNIDYIKTAIGIKEYPERFHCRNGFNIGYVGSLGSAQGLSIILQATIELNKIIVNNNVTIILIGEGAEKVSLEKMGEKIPNVKILGGTTREIALKFLSSCDVAFVSLKNEEVFKKNIPSKIFEAMALGLPVLISAPRGEATDIINENNMGLCANPNDPKELANAIILLKKDSEKLKMYARNSLSASKKYNRKQQSTKLIDLIQKIKTIC